MQARLTLSLALSSLLLAACSSSSNSPRAVATPAATNTNGSPVTGVLTVRFDPTTGKIPLPNNLLLSGTTDLTLNPPVVNPANFGDPLVAVSSLDGWSTVAPWTFQFQGGATPAAASVVAGTSVRIFEVALTGPGGAVTRIIRELAAPAEFVTAVTTVDARDTNGVASQGVAILPTQPLKQLTSYMAVVTDGITDTLGNDATPDTTYFLTKRTSPLCVAGVSTDPLIPNANACGLEPVRQLTNAQLVAAAGAGIVRDRVVASWVATTQAITPVLQAVRSRITPQPNLLVPTGRNISDAGLPPVADIFFGFLSLPYYLQPPTAANPTGPLNGFWRAAPGAYVPPFNAFGLSPTSTNITFANPFPVANATVRVPILMTVPNAASGRTRPASGWPIVLFQHGITRNRTDMLAISATMAAQGFVVVAIDQPLHGVSPGNADFATTAPFYVSPGNPLTAPLAAAGVVERTFNVDYINNATRAFVPDMIPDASGIYTLNVGSLLTSRDNLRQAQADLFVLAATAPRFDLDGNGTPDIDGSRMVFVGQSLGSMVGIPFLAFEPTVNVGLLSVPGGGIAQFVNASPTLGPPIRAQLLAGAGLTPGTPDFNRFLGAAQQVLDAADPINYGFLTATDAIVLHEVVGGGGSPAALPDQVIPNSVPGAPLAGTEPLIRALGLTTITATTQAANGVRGAVRFTRGGHGSLLSPADSLPVTLEMQGQMASFLASGGAAVLVQDTSVIRSP